MTYTRTACLLSSAVTGITRPRVLVCDRENKFWNPITPRLTTNNNNPNPTPNPPPPLQYSAPPRPLTATGVGGGRGGGAENVGSQIFTGFPPASALRASTCSPPPSLTTHTAYGLWFVRTISVLHPSTATSTSRCTICMLHQLYRQDHPPTIGEIRSPSEFAQQLSNPAAPDTLAGNWLH